MQQRSKDVIRTALGSLFGTVTWLGSYYVARKRSAFLRDRYV